MRGTPFSGVGAGDGEECVGEHGQGDVSVPAVVAADLVVVQADLALRGLEGLLDRPAGCRPRGPTRAAGSRSGPWQT